MRKNTSWTAADYERVMVDAYRQEGIAVVSQDGMSFARVTAKDEAGTIVMTEINVSRIAREMARVLS